jgi:hypothetical protein
MASNTINLILIFSHMRVQKQMAQTPNIHHLLCKCSIPLAVQWAIIMITIMRDIKYQYEVYGVRCHFQQYFSYIVVFFLCCSLILRGRLGSNHDSWIYHYLCNQCARLVGLWCLTPLSTIFQLYRGCQFYWWEKPDCPEKTIDFIT